MLLRVPYYWELNSYFRTFYILFKAKSWTLVVLLKLYTIIRIQITWLHLLYWYVKFDFSTTGMLWLHWGNPVRYYNSNYEKQSWSQWHKIAAVKARITGAAAVNSSKTITGFGFVWSPRVKQFRPWLRRFGLVWNYYFQTRLLFAALNSLL